MSEDVWVHPGVAVGRSSIEGDGLFASDDLPVGTVVVRFGGRIVSTAELADLIAAADADPDAAYVDTITIDEGTHLVMPPGTLAHYANHSCAPNLWHVGPYELAARRDIAAGEELTVDYATHSGAPGFDMACRCGAEACRGEITGMPFIL